MNAVTLESLGFTKEDLQERLIAAAPDLLSALKDLAACCGDDDDKALLAAMRAAVVAINKAEDRS